MCTANTTNCVRVYPEEYSDTLINCRIFISVSAKDWTGIRDNEDLCEQIHIYAGCDVDPGFIPELPHMSSTSIATLQCIPVYTPRHPFFNSIVWFIVHCQEVNYISQYAYENIVLDNVATALNLVYHPERVNCSYLIKQQIRDCLADVFDTSRPHDGYGIFIDACDFVNSETITLLSPLVDDVNATLLYYDVADDDEWDSYSTYIRDVT